MQRTMSWLRSHLVTLAWATLVANIAIVVSGGVVRITGSGLGCPTWPQCTEESFVPHGALGIHGVIEFGNRMITFAIAAVAIATFLASLRHPHRRVRWLAALLAVGVPLQAVVGGISVLTELNPWVVALHLLLSMAMIMLSVLLLLELTTAPVPAEQTAAASIRMLARLVLLISWAVLYTGTMVTGAGPHAGDVDAPRNGMDPEGLSQLHADFVMLLVGLTLAAWVLARQLPLTPVARRGLNALMAIEIAQASVGFAQFFSGVPIPLVGVHLLGSALTAASAAWFAFGTKRTTPPLGFEHDHEFGNSSVGAAPS